MKTNFTPEQWTPYQEINKILSTIQNGCKTILGQNLTGLYLFGSLTYGDFNINSSDIDLVAVTNTLLNLDELQQIKELHKNIGALFPNWFERLECSYTPTDLFTSLLPPKTPRPYFGGGIFYDEAPYGNEWTINNYLLYKHGIALIGHNFKKLIEPIPIIEVQKACIRDLFDEWEPKIKDNEWLSNSHYQSYLILNLCRILYTVMCGKTGSKKISAQWVKQKYDLPFSRLINKALRWKYGEIMNSKNEAIDFIHFTINEIKKTSIYNNQNN